MAAVWTGTQLTPENLAYLRELPMGPVQIDALTEICHGTPFDEDGKAVVKRVRLSSELGVNAIVEDGLSGGEQVIVEGLQSVRPGIAVRATPVPAPLKDS